MSNIQGPHGLNTPSFQAASSKQDGGGNGSGGMYFGQEEEYQEESNFNFFDDDFNTVRLENIPFTGPPLFGSAPTALTSWKTALATLLYQEIHKQAHNPEYNNP